MEYRKNNKGTEPIGEITPEFKQFLNETRDLLKGGDRRMFMAKVVRLLGPGGQRRAERELGWNRGAIVKGEKELASGFRCVDNFSGRGRKSTERKFPNLPGDIKSIAWSLKARPIRRFALTIRTVRFPPAKFGDG